MLFVAVKMLYNCGSEMQLSRDLITTLFKVHFISPISPFDLDEITHFQRLRGNFVFQPFFSQFAITKTNFGPFWGTFVKQVRGKIDSLYLLGAPLTSQGYCHLPPSTSPSICKYVPCPVEILEFWDRLTIQ